MRNKIEFKKYNSGIGFEYEFYSNMTPKAVKSSIQKFLGQKIIMIDDPKNTDYSKELMEDRNLVLTVDKSGGIDMLELITPPYQYSVAKDINRKICSWIKDFGYTTKQSGIHLNLNISDRSIQNNLDIFKFILSFNENLVYDLFPQRKDNIYCVSIKHIYPKNLHIDLKPEYRYNYILPETKYFGVNFSKMSKNYLEYRYIGGENYHKKIDQIEYLMDYFIDHLYDVLDNPQINNKDRIEFARIINPIKQNINNFLSYEAFKIGFPKIQLTADLKSDNLVLKTHWSHIIKYLFPLLNQNKVIGECKINYNTDSAQIEFANAKLVGVNFFNIGLFNCEVKGVYTRCTAEGCVFDKAALYASKVNNCTLNQSKVFNTQATNCEFNNVYVSGAETPESYISGTFNDGILAKAYVQKSNFTINEENLKNGLIKIIDVIEI